MRYLKLTGSVRAVIGGIAWHESEIWVFDGEKSISPHNDCVFPGYGARTETITLPCPAPLTLLPQATGHDNAVCQAVFPKAPPASLLPLVQRSPPSSRGHAYYYFHSLSKGIGFSNLLKFKSWFMSTPGSPAPRYHSCRWDIWRLTSTRCDWLCRVNRTQL